MPGKVKVNGAWKDVPEIYTKVNGAWKSVVEAYTKVNGTWQQWFASASSSMELIQSYSFSSNFSSFTINNIPTNYETLLVTYSVISTSTGVPLGDFKMNGTSNDNYFGYELDSRSSGKDIYNSSDVRFPFTARGDAAFVNHNMVWIYRYNTSTTDKNAYRRHAATAYYNSELQTGNGGTLRTNINGALTSLTIDGTTYDQISEVRLYGILGV